jgi:TetR/AcrR family transcriptional repressor of nem operon
MRRLQGSIVTHDAMALARIVFAYSEGLLLHARMWNDLSRLDEFESGAKIILGVKSLNSLHFLHSN